MMCRREFLGRWVGVAIAIPLLGGLLTSCMAGRGSNAQRHDCQGDLRTVNWVGRNLEGIDCDRQIFREADLSEANLRRAILRGTDFSGRATRLIDTDLRDADLTQALLVGTQAIRADFSGAILREADLSGASLSGARFEGADLQGAILTGANLVGANLSDLKHTPAYLDNADLTNAALGESLDGVRLCNTIMPSGSLSKQGCFSPSHSLQLAAADQDWRWMDQETSTMFVDAFKPTEPEGQSGTSSAADQLTPEQIQSMPCEQLKTLDQLWRSASGDRFSFSIQRQIWESPEVNQDYAKFADAVGWRANGTWLKFDDLVTQTRGVPSQELAPGLFPWHRWQVQEPTETEPTRFRRVGFGAWMARLRTCGI